MRPNVVIKLTRVISRFLTNGGSASMKAAIAIEGMMRILGQLKQLKLKKTRQMS